MDSVSLNSHLKRVYIDKELCKLIKCVKNVALITTWGEVIDGLREYITKKQLFDFNQMKVFCHNDDLEQLFGVSEFEILDIKDLLKRLVFPIRGVKDSAEVPTSIPTVSDSLKRKNEEISEEIKPKKTFEYISPETSRAFMGECSFLTQDASPMMLHIPLSPKIESESESVDSVQCYETSVVKDTSDDSIFYEEVTDHTHTEYLPEGIITVAETFELEYEPLSEGSSEDLSACDSDSESDLDFIRSLNSIITFVSKADSDLEYLADMSSDEGGGSDSSLSYGYDAEISEEDLWQCTRCSSINNPPNRFCSKCFSTRQGWLANEKTPERRKRRKPRSKRKKRKDKKDPTLSANSKSLGLPCTSKESPSLVREDVCENSKFMSSQSTNESSETKLCLLCCSKPVNSSIIHGKFAHSFSCFGCAKRLQMRKRRCPICRRTIERVVYQISA